MSRNKKQPLSKPLMVRLKEEMKQDVEAIARANDLTSSDIVRLAIRLQLPAIKSGRTNLQSS